jgi:UDP-N-acetyl-D-glucosamine dehydrogenase
MTNFEGLPADRLRSMLDASTARVGIIGLGYVGLPLAMALASKFEVLGFDLDEAKTSMLSRGELYLPHLASDALADMVSSGRLSATTNFTRLCEPDVLLICVPTPLTRRREPDMAQVTAAAQQIRDYLRPGQLVILESTTYPGATEELVRPILEESTLTCGQDFFVAFSPERQDPGNPDHASVHLPKVVGGVDPIALELAEMFYRRIVPRVVRVSSARVAEATKLTENIFRAVNIALVNELKIIYDRMGIDIWEVLDAAATKPFGFMRFDPGPGWGGHCIPLDPFFLTWKAHEVGQTTGFIELAGHVNYRMHEFVLEKLTLALNERGRAVKGSAILVLGLAYKRDVADPRESPAIEIIDRLLRLGADVSYHDPHIQHAPRLRNWQDRPPMKSVPLDASRLAASDAIVIATDHSSCDYAFVLAHAPLIIDTRGVFRKSHPRVIRA